MQKTEKLLLGLGAGLLLMSLLSKRSLASSDAQPLNDIPVVQPTQQVHILPYFEPAPVEVKPVITPIEAFLSRLSANNIAWLKQSVSLSQIPMIGAQDYRRPTSLMDYMQNEGIGNVQENVIRWLGGIENLGR